MVSGMDPFDQHVAEAALAAFNQTVPAAVKSVADRLVAVALADSRTGFPQQIAEGKQATPHDWAVYLVGRMAKDEGQLPAEWTVDAVWRVMEEPDDKTGIWLVHHQLAQRVMASLVRAAAVRYAWATNHRDRLLAVVRTGLPVLTPPPRRGLVRRPAKD